ncbi:ABC transporter substrate-binding protein [Pullulanibacillus sp. KACC 23026]|uniref:ABC transporter substrate-binding protein n=1 Tax=Pullulanibacillus sp. KACC 23026 TaxID=3028315 RepID=UPI0023AF02FA|nr:ABC transporter substrate-binding protein [Pullulanibacillus sp. KACC 23026]WEG11066.1 ABC transporter substrate-binding protein [Pullulanibacillus sp. KACC 23026]
MRMSPIKKMFFVFLGILLVVALAGCSGINSTSTTANGKFKGTITMYAGNYSPTAVLQANQKPATELKKLADEYYKKTGVKIEFIKGLPASQDYMTWVRTKAAGGQLPDVIWSQWYDANSSLAQGTLQDLSKYYKQPDPYADNKPWSSLLNSQIVSETKAPNGSSYVLNGDYVGTATFYNKDAFKKAGITTLPETWSEFIDACKKLKAAGYTPFSWDLASTPTGMDRLTWLSRLFYTNFYSSEYKQLLFTGNETMTTEDQVIAIKKGIFGPKNKKWLALYPIIKSFSQYWQKDYTGGDSNGQGNMLAFVKGNVGMYFDGSWAASQIASAKPSFNWGSFKNPYPDPSTSQYATNFDSSASIGGPSSAFQFAVASQKADNTITPAKEKAIIDWLMFITTPEHDQSIVNELGQYVPTVKGAQAIPALKNLSALTNKPLNSVFGGINLTEEEQDAIYRAFQSYITGDVTLNQFAQTCDTQMNQAADKLIAQNHWDLSKYLNN